MCLASYSIGQSEQLWSLFKYTIIFEILCLDIQGFIPIPTVLKLYQFAESLGQKKYLTLLFNK